VQERDRHDRVEVATLDKEVTHVLEEARMIVPGIQALFGFQLIVVFNAAFRSNLERTLQILHLGALCSIAVSMGLIMAPAAYHRQVERGYITARLARIASRFVQGALASLLVGVVLDVYLVGFVILGSDALAVTIALLMFLSLAGMWFVFPAFAKARHRLPSPTATSPRERSP
jgi:hypothetical protein